MKKCVSVILTAAILLTVVFCAVPAAAAQTIAEKVAQYSYKITPLLQPFNDYFFVETDNPNPKSFRFIDQTTVYDAKGDDISFCNYAFADIHYDNPETRRVNGGYIFYSTRKIDGGEIMLQAADVNKESDYEDYSSWYYSVVWENTGKTFTLPRLVDGTDYLIETYAAGDSFFDKMDAVQKGFNSVCLYSGSYLRGTIERTNDYWMAAAVGHVDQSLYIYSPYDRKDSKALFATAVYPFRYECPKSSTAHRPINGMKNTTIWLILPVTVLPKATAAPATAKDRESTRKILSIFHSVTTARRLRWTAPANGWNGMPSCPLRTMCRMTTN